MQATESYVPLVKDALYSRRMRHRGCFVSNMASAELRKIGGDVLPAIEHVVMTDVSPFYQLEDVVLHSRFPGLLNVFADYFQIAKTRIEQAISFFQSIHGSVRVVAMQAIDLVYREIQPTTPIPESLLAEIRPIAEYGNGRSKELASIVLGQEPITDFKA